MGPGFGADFGKAIVTFTVVVGGAVAAVLVALFFLCRWLFSHLSIAWN